MTEPSNNKLQIRLPLLFAAVLAVGMFIGQQLPRHDKNVHYLSKTHGAYPAGTLDEILRYVQARYVDSVDLNHVKADAIRHLLAQLDPHSVYISPEEIQAVEDDMSGEFEGVGIEFLLVDDTISISSTLPGGPSEAVGILPGDKIITIGAQAVAGVNIQNPQIFKYLRGAKGSQVQLGIRRGQEQALRHFTVTRDVIPVHSVDVAYMLDERSGYIKINRFSAVTYKEFMEALRPMVEEKGLQNLVIDLRGNPGGYLGEATDLLSQFFSEGKLLVYTQGRSEARRDYKSNGRARFNLQNIAVLIDEGSASASEIVAGAIQDWDRGWVVGRRSFGKGLVQEQYPLSDGGGLRLTVSRYYTPSGRSIQRPYAQGTDAYEADLEQRFDSGEMADASRIKVSDSTRYYTGQGRIVYGGGGITPDVFIPLDTSFMNDYYYALRQHLPQFAARWMENRDRSTLPGTLAEFAGTFKISDDMMDGLVAYAEKQGNPRNPAQLARCRGEIALQLKARIARSLFQQEGLYRILNEEDPAVEKALQLLRSGEPVAKR
jgi:carboxyl-terminal processing protease